MFGISGTELIVILIVALLIFGPRRLPEIGTAIGRTVREFHRQLNDMERTVSDAARAVTEPPTTRPKQDPSAQPEAQPKEGAKQARQGDTAELTSEHRQDPGTEAKQAHDAA